jgi:hypothetical protein
MLAVLELGAELARDWRTPLDGARLAELRHQGPDGDGPAMPAACRPLPPPVDGDVHDLFGPGKATTGRVDGNVDIPLYAWALRCAAAIGYAVVERELPPPKDQAAGFTAREHAVIFVNPLRPGGAAYPDAASRRAELALTLVHELVHTVDPDEHAFAYSFGHAEREPDPVVGAAEAASGRRSELVAMLATEALVANGCGGSQLRYLAALLRSGTAPAGIELEGILDRACTAIDVLADAAQRPPWLEPSTDLGHALKLGDREVALTCGPAAHGGSPPHAAAEAAAHWSRQRATALAQRVTRAAPIQSVQALLSERDNDHRSIVAGWERAHDGPWHRPARRLGSARPTVSVVIPVRNRAYCIGPVLDALHQQTDGGALEVIVVDDASTDATREVVAAHPIRPQLVALPRNRGAGAARNVGAARASGETLLFLDADMVLPPDAVAQVAERSSPPVLLIGFFEEVKFDAGAGRHVVPDRLARPEADYRVLWRRGAGRVLDSAGNPVQTPEEIRVLDETADLVELGFGRKLWMWDLPRLVLGKLFALPRHALIDVGGFHPAFQGWGCEETHLAALVIAAGLKVVPVRCLTGFHLGEPDPAAALEAKLRTWPENLATYHRLLAEPPETGGAELFARRVVTH